MQRLFNSKMNDQVCSALSPANPLSYCMFPTLNSQFIHGSSSSGLLYGTSNTNCSNFMSQRCAQGWDGFCEAFQMINVDTYYPNTATIDTTAFELAQFFLKNTPTIGDNLVRNSVYLRFIQLPRYVPHAQPFDPTVANSPPVVIFGNTVISSSVLQNLDTPETDPFVTKMLENPNVCFDVLARIYIGVLRKEPEASAIRGTRLDNFFRRNKKLFDEYFEVALPRVPSLQYDKHPTMCSSNSRGSCH